MLSILLLSLCAEWRRKIIFSTTTFYLQKNKKIRREKKPILPIDLAFCDFLVVSYLVDDYHGNEQQEDFHSLKSLSFCGSSPWLIDPLKTL